MNLKIALTRRSGRTGITLAIVAVGVMLLLTVRYTFSRSNVMRSETAIELIVGEKGDAFVRRNPTIVNIDRQPAGLNFYEMSWSTKAMGKVIVNKGPLGLWIDNVLSVTSTEDMDYPTEGILEIKINSTITNSDTIDHDEARLKTFAYLQKISQLGWKSTVPPGMARIRGKDMNNYLLKTGRQTTLDSSYVPTLSEWMQYGSLTTWAFYADHVFLTVQVTREHTLTDPLKPGAYLLSTSFQNESEHFRRFVDGLERDRWRELLPGRVETLQRIRKKKEDAFRLEGVAIDENYIDPPFPVSTQR